MPLRSASAREALPATARELVQVIGIDATIDLVKMFGGDELKIPVNIEAAPRIRDILIETIGPAAAEKLVQRYTGTWLYIPTCRIALIALRDRSIIERFDAGEDFDKLRREHKITRRHLYRILKKPTP